MLDALSFTLIIIAIALAWYRPILFLQFAVPLFTLQAGLNATLWPVRLQLLGQSIYLLDVYCIAATAVALLRPRRVGVSASSRRLLGIWLALIVVSITQGSLTFGLGSAVNDARRPLYVIAAATFVLALSDEERRAAFSKRFATASLGMSAVLIVAARLVPFPMQTDSRILTSQAVVAVVGVILCASLNGHEIRLPHILGISAIVLLSGQRTVILTLLPLLLTLFWNAASRGRANNQALVAFLRFAGVGVLLLLAGTLSVVLSAQFDAGLAAEGTFAWRISSWTTLVSELSGIEWLVGKPYGSSYLREVFGLRWSVYSHSEYVQVLLRTGLLGLSVLFSIVVVILRSLSRLEDRAAARLGLATLVMLLIAGVSFDWSLGQGILLGALIALCEGGGRNSRSRLHDVSQSDGKDTSISTKARI